jgi:RND superfamily putative drug exporter
MNVNDPPRRETGGEPARRSLLVRWSMAVALHHRLVIALWLPPLVAAAALYPVLQARLAAPDYSVSGSESAREQAVVADRFTALGAEQDVIVFRSRGYVAGDAAYRRVVERVLNEARGEPDVALVVSPYEADGSARVSADGHVSVALVGLGGDNSLRARLADDLQRRVGRRAAGTGVEAYLSGYSPLNNDLSAIELSGQERAESIGVPIALAVLLLVLGSVVAAALPVVLAVAGVLVCMGVLTLLAGPLHLDQFVTVITTMIGIGVGIDYALFVLSRFREELAGRTPPDGGRPGRAATIEAVGVALDTSGRTILASGLIVIVALGSLMVIRGHVFFEIAMAAGLVVACALCAGLTLLPAILAWLGSRVNALALPRLQPLDARAGAAPEASLWARWARLVLRRPVRFGLPAILLLVTAAVPLASMRLGLDLGLASLGDTPSGRAQEIAAASFGQGVVGPVQLAVCATHGRLDTAGLDGVARLGAALGADHRVARVASPTDLLDHLTGGHAAADLQGAAARPDLRSELARMFDVDHGGRCALLQVVLTVPVDSEAATGFVDDVRARIGPRALAATGTQLLVGGLTAQYADLSAETTGKLPLVIAIVLALSFCYLLVVFRSVLLPIKAVAMNLLATAAALGSTVFLFQHGHGAQVLRFTSVGTLQAYLPVALFALLFGLSMDYEVFLVSRMREEWLRSRDNSAAVATALAHTGRQITAAAAIMAAVFGSFLVTGVLELKQFGFALSVAVLLDATVIRLLIVPAVMGIAGTRNWWLPASAARLVPWPRLD